MSSPPKVLVIRGGAIGDFILTLPAIRLLRESIPSARVEILGYKPIIDLAVAAGLADATHHLDHVTMAKLFVPNATLDAKLTEWLQSFNLIVSYLFDPDAILRGNMERLGVRTYLECPHRVEPGRGHAALQLARPLEKIAMFMEEPYGPADAFPFGTAAPKQRVIAVHPGSGSMQKNWPIEHWIAAGSRLAQECPEQQLALITGEAEHERGITEQITSAWRELNFIHWNMLPLVELASRLASTSAFLGHDSGISHLAAACAVPCLLFFGPTDPGTWAPCSDRVRVVVAPTGNLEHLSLEIGLREMREFLQSAGNPLGQVATPAALA
ncbi:MAG: glycosyltransferase family 9 protein [Roseimicrobium sp.]